MLQHLVTGCLWEIQHQTTPIQKRVIFFSVILAFGVGRGTRLERVTGADRSKLHWSHVRAEVFPTIKNDWCKKHSENLFFNKKNLASKVSLTETKIYRYLRMTSCSPDEKVPNCSSRTVWVPAGAFRLVPWIAIDHNVCCSEVKMPTVRNISKFLVENVQKKNPSPKHTRVRMDPLYHFSQKKGYICMFITDVGFEPPGRLKCEGYCKDETPVSYKFYMLERSSKRTPTKPHHFAVIFWVKTGWFNQNVLGVTHAKTQVVLRKIGKNYDFVRESRRCPCGNCRSRALSGLPKELPPIEVIVKWSFLKPIWDPLGI